MLVLTLEERIAAARTLLRIRPEAMTTLELDWGAALLQGLSARLLDAVVVEVNRNSGWKRYSPTTDWADYGELVSSHSFVSSSRPRYDNPDDDDLISGYYYSCHAFYGGTEVTGDDLRQTVAECAVRLLEHRVQCENLK